MKHLCITLFIFTLFTLQATAATIQLPQTGQTLCYDTAGAVIACAGTGQDGDTTAGVAWPTPRFTDNGNGTVTDNLTKLIWLKNANCVGVERVWTSALATANSVQSGYYGLTDGSKIGDWRLPSLNELESLVDASRSNPALPAGHPFSNVQGFYWSSSTYAFNTNVAWGVSMYGGNESFSNKTSGYYVWPVRSGQ